MNLERVLLLLCFDTQDFFGVLKSVWAKSVPKVEKHETTCDVRQGKHHPLVPTKSCRHGKTQAGGLGELTPMRCCLLIL